MILENDFENKITKLYKGFYNTDNSFKRILIVTHSGFIKEIINFIKTMKGLNIIEEDDEPKTTSVYIIRSYCTNCSTKCENKETCNVRFEVMLYNDTSHLESFFKLEDKFKASD